MGQQKGYIHLKGTFGELTFYRRKGEWVVRKKTSIDGNRIKRDPSFKKFRERGKQFGKESKIAKGLYPILKKKNPKLGYGKINGACYRLVMEGRDRRDIEAALMMKFGV
jgi:hypothetical protein